MEAVADLRAPDLPFAICEEFRAAAPANTAQAAIILIATHFAWCLPEDLTRHDAAATASHRRQRITRGALQLPFEFPASSAQAIWKVPEVFLRRGGRALQRPGARCALQGSRMQPQKWETRS